jgi:hypothetical protein
MQLQKQQSALLERMYGSVDAARAAWAEQERQSKALEAARAYCWRTGIPFRGIWSARQAVESQVAL